jgi:dATP pyrophosphohydrolase
MPPLRSTHVEVYLFRRRGRRVEFLLLRRSTRRRTLPGVWQPVTGKRLARERMLDAAMREVREETGFMPRRWWALETMTLYPDVEGDAIMALPLFAAEVDPRRTVRLSREHVAAAWLGAPEAARRVLWETQRRGLAAVRREVLASPRLAKALEVTPKRV